MELKNLIEQELTNALAASRAFMPASDAAAFDKALMAPMAELLSRGGKRWRPQLLVYAAQALGGTLKQALPLTPVPELLHNATLIIDDLEDGSLLRRGKPAIHRVFGTDIAVNAANFFYFYAGQYAAKVTPKKYQAQVQAIIQEEMTNVHLGQALDIFWHNHLEHPVNEAQYLEMARLKTGTMARLAARLGALIAGGSAKQQARLGQFAETLGAAFQIKDDIDNITATGRPGKTFGDDITEGKRSLIIIRALDQLPAQKAVQLKRILASHPADHLQIEQALAIIASTDALAYSAAVAARLKKKAIAMLNKLDQARAASLAALAERIG